MMTLDEAIKHCEEKAKELRTEAEQLRDIGEEVKKPVTTAKKKKV